MNLRLPTDILQTHSVMSVLILLLACTVCLSACPQQQDTQQAGAVPAGVGQAEPAEAEQVVPPPVADSEEENPVAEALETEPVEQSPDQQETNEAAEDSNEDANKDDKDKRERPQPKPRRPGEIVSIEIEFTRAKYNTAEDATLSELFFEFRANLGRMKTKTAEVKLSDVLETVAGELDMGLCIVEIYPVVNPPVELGHAGSGGGRFRIDGAFQVKLYTPERELMAVFGIATEGKFMSAPPDEMPEGFGIRARQHVGEWGPVPYTIYRRNPVTTKTEYLLTVEYSEGTFDSHVVEDSSYNHYEYQFPNGLLEFYLPQIGEKESNKRPAVR